MSFLETLMHRVDALRAGDGRVLVGVAGAPGSGKSTVADQLVAAIRDRDGPSAAALLPMDGFHRDNAELDAMGLRAVKGAPETFDADAFVALVRAVRTARHDISYPLFDRAQDRTLPDAGTLPAATPIVVFEGNYLLLRDAPWADLGPLFDLTVMLSVPIAELRARLIQRWLDHGLSREDATHRAEGNDIPNAEAVIARSATADLVLPNGASDPAPAQ